MTIMVTGAAGFIGSHFTNLLVKMGVEVIAVDCLTYASNLTNIESKDVEFFKIDIRDKQSLEKIIGSKKIEKIINFAAETHVDNSISNPSPFLTTNILGVTNLLDCCLKYNVEKFIQISTDEVFGSLKTGFANENAKLNPSSPYSASKASAELLSSSYVRTYQLNTNIIRLSNNYGPKQFDEKLIPYLIKSLAKGKKIGIYGNGLNIREWIFVSDAVEGIIQVMNNGTNGESYNISSGVFKTNLEVLESVSLSLGIENPNFDFIEDRKGHDFRYALDSNKINSELGWKSETSFDHGLTETVNWYRNHRNWWDK